MTGHAYREHQDTLLRLCLGSIRCGLDTGKPLAVAPGDYPPLLREPRATFVTLKLESNLRGCIGSLEAHCPLVEDLASNAFSAAFRDPRFPPVSAPEVERLEIHISILTPMEPMSFSSEQDLVEQLRPGQDGLLLVEGPRRGTFLPSVWESLPQPEAFVRHLKQKAGLPEDYWSSSLEVYRYGTVYLPEQ